MNYRTPGLIMSVASRMLEMAGIQTTPPTSAREGRWPPSAHAFAAGDRAALSALVRAERDAVFPGSLAVITSRADLGAVTAAVVEALGRDALAEYGAAEGAVSVVPVEDVKGLEFDGVVLVEPATILAESPRGASDLYVAMTRPTQRLVVAHSGDAPGRVGRPGAVAPDRGGLRSRRRGAAAGTSGGTRAAARCVTTAGWWPASR